MTLAFDLHHAAPWGFLVPPVKASRAENEKIGIALRQVRKRAPDVPRIRTHDLRVTFISLALRRGVKPEVVARMVGHSSPLITLRIYRQVFEDEFTEARDMLADLV